MMAIQAERCRRSLYEFVKTAWHVAEPVDHYTDGWHVEAICDHLQAVTEGSIRHLLINIPPGHAKSLIVAVLWPAWVWTFRPGWRGLFTAYAHDLVVRDAVRSRKVITDPWYVERFVNVGEYGTALWRLTEDMNRKDMYTNTASGARTSISTTSKSTGLRGNCVVADDPNGPGCIVSKAERDETIRVWSKIMPSRVHDVMVDCFVAIQQRLHEEDLSGFLINGGKYEKLILPSEYEPARRARTFYFKKHLDGTKTRELFWEDPRTERGELLFAERFPQVALDEMKDPSVMGADGFATQHQQLPAPAEGLIFKKKDWRFWRHSEAFPARSKRPAHCYMGDAKILPKLDYIIGTVDCAFKDEDTSDYVAMQVIGVRGAERYVIDRVNGKLDFLTTCTTLERMAKKWSKVNKWLVEDKANGTAVVNALKSKIRGIIAIDPEGGKLSRANGMQPTQQAGQIYLPDGEPWLADFVDQFAIFPKGKNDDEVDALSQGVNHLNNPDVVRLLGMLAVPLT